MSHGRKITCAGFKRSLLPLLPLLGLCAIPHGLSAPTNPAAAYQAKREHAATLFNQGKRLEALPLLQELVKANPRDGQMPVALAACLVEHAATLSDPEAAGKERLQARELLEQARDLGNSSTLALNLAELLNKLPSSGALEFSDNPGVQEAMLAGEAAFSRRDFDLAIKNYSKALELDPGNYAAALFIANSYDKGNHFRAACEWYERAIRQDPDIETAYRYYADMLAKEGDMAGARKLLIHAAVAEPYNRMVWRELRAWAALNNTHINEIFVAVPAPVKAQPLGFREPPEIAAVWQAYRNVSGRWQSGGDQFKKHFPEAKEYRHSLLEESEGLAAAATLLKRLSENEKTVDLVRNDPNASLLLRLYEARLIEAYILFSLGDRGTAQDYLGYRAKHRDKLDEYLDKFVVPPGNRPPPPVRPGA
jgi:tetratricopeptide (TPR) repeat protein